MELGILGGSLGFVACLGLSNYWLVLNSGRFLVSYSFSRFNSYYDFVRECADGKSLLRLFESGAWPVNWGELVIWESSFEL